MKPRSSNFYRNGNAFLKSKFHQLKINVRGHETGVKGERKIKEGGKKFSYINREQQPIKITARRLDD